MSTENLQQNGEKISPVVDQKGKIIPGLFVFDELHITEEDKTKFRSEIMDPKLRKLVEESEKFL